MSTLKTHNLQSPDAGSVNIALAPNAGMIVAGISTFNNRVLIGTAIEGNPTGENLTIADSGNMGLTLRSTSSNYCNIYFSDATSGTAEYEGYMSYNHATDSLEFATVHTEKLRITSEGKLGINYNSPVTIIHALGNSNVGTSVTMTLQSHDTPNATSGLNLLARRNDNVNETCKIQAASGGQNSVHLQFHTNSGEKLRITSAGLVGIGTDNPAKKLEVFDNTHAVARIRGGAGGSNSSRKAELSLFASGAREYVIRADAADAAFKIYDASDGNADRLYINSSGSLGVNLSSPKTTKGVHISKGAGDGGIGNSYSLANEYLHFGYSEHNSSGNLGLFTMGFGYVAGGTPATNSPAYFGYKEESTAGYTKGNLVFATRDAVTDSAPTERVRIQSDGEVFIGDALGGSNRSTQVSIVGADQSPTGVWAQVGVYSNDSQAANKGGSLSFGGQDGSTPRQTFAAIKGAKENGTSGNYAGYMAFYTRPAGDVSAERMRISSTGQVTKPSQIAFHVWDSVSSNAFSSNSYADWNSVVLNRGNCYSTSNGRFTCTVAGTYGFWCNMLSNGSARLFHEFRKNGSQVAGTRTESGTNAGLYQTNTTQAILPLAVGDWVAIHVGSGGAYGSSFSSWCGYLLG